MGDRDKREPTIELMEMESLFQSTLMDPKFVRKSHVSAEKYNDIQKMIREIGCSGFSTLLSQESDRGTCGSCPGPETSFPSVVVPPTRPAGPLGQDQKLRASFSEDVSDEEFEEVDEEAEEDEEEVEVVEVLEMFDEPIDRFEHSSFRAHTLLLVLHMAGATTKGGAARSRTANKSSTLPHFVEQIVDAPVPQVTFELIMKIRCVTMLRLFRDGGSLNCG